MTLRAALGVALLLMGLGLLLPPVHGYIVEAPVKAAVAENLVSHKSLLNTSPPPTNVAVNDTLEYSLNGTINIESEGFEAVLMDDVTDEQLDLGAGHYPGTAFPGQAGNFGVAAHRGLIPDIDTMGPGDEIIVNNNGVKYTYEWRESFVVAPDRVDVLDSMEGKWLTLTTCHPRYSNAQRLIVRAELTQVGG